MYIILDVTHPTRSPVGPFNTLQDAQTYRGALAANVDTTAMVCLPVRAPDPGLAGEDWPEDAPPLEVYADPEACPGCGCMPGDGITPGCNHEDGCGTNRMIEDAEAWARANPGAVMRAEREDAERRMA